jgi:hypothetical protein
MNAINMSVEQGRRQTNVMIGADLNDDPSQHERLARLAAIIERRGRGVLVSSCGGFRFVSGYFGKQLVSVSYMEPEPLPFVPEPYELAEVWA